MARPAKQPDGDEEVVLVPASTLFPIEVLPPVGFDPDDLGTWPDNPGRFEYVDGRLLYMPPCGEIQPAVAADTEVAMGAKAAAYLNHGVRIVWPVLPQSGEVVVLTPGFKKFDRYSRGMSTRF